MVMQLVNEVKASLKRESVLCSNAIAFYKKAVKDFENTYQLNTRTFLKKFDSGQLGDDADFFDWYAYSKLLEQWQKTLSAIRSAVR